MLSRLVVRARKISLESLYMTCIFGWILGSLGQGLEQDANSFASSVCYKIIVSTDGHLEDGVNVTVNLLHPRVINRNLARNGGFFKSSGTESKEHDTSNRSGNDAHVDDADIRPIYDEEKMAEVQTTAEINVFAAGQQHTEQPEFNNEGEVDQNT
nr:hypothetical protein [Tanacetum cinerariifolium]